MRVALVLLGSFLGFAGVQGAALAGMLAPVQLSVHDAANIPVQGSVGAGTTVVFEGFVPHPRTDPAPTTVLSWQVVGPDGAVLDHLSQSKTMQRKGGASVQRLRLDTVGMASGTYRVTLMHQPQGVPHEAVMASTTVTLLPAGAAQPPTVDVPQPMAAVPAQPKPDPMAAFGRRAQALLVPEAPPLPAPVAVASAPALELKDMPALTSAAPSKSTPYDDTVPPPAHRPFPDEMEAMAALEAADTPLNRVALAAVRHKHALGYHAAFKTNGDPEMLRWALWYAHSAAHLDPENAHAWRLLGAMSYHHRVSLTAEAQAMDALARTVALDPIDAGSRILLADLYKDKGLWAQAVDVLEGGFLADLPVARSTMTERLVLACMMGDLSRRGVAFFDELLAQEPDAADLRLARAMLLRHHYKNDEAMADVEAVLLADAASPRVRDTATKLMEYWLNTPNDPLKQPERGAL